jgi:hypothetical protein
MHALAAERTQLQGDKAIKQFRAKRSHGEGGRQLEESSLLLLLLPLFSSLATFLFSTTTKFSE